MAAAGLAQIPDVDIDSDGVFKYVLIRVHAAPPSGTPAGETKEIVRGYKWAEYHADIYDKVSGEMQKKGYDCECLGGGRISHQSQDRKIHVYGYSMVSQQLRAPVLAGEHPALLSHRTLPPGPAASRFPRCMTQETGSGWEPVLAPHGLCAVPARKAWPGLCPPVLRVLQHFEVASTALELDCLPLLSPLYLQGHGAPRASSASGWRALPPGWLPLEATFPPGEWPGWLGG